MIMEKNTTNNKSNERKNDKVMNNTINNKDGKLKRSVTMINSRTLPSFGTERYYLLSELEAKSHSITFLKEDNDDDDDGSNTAASSATTADDEDFDSIMTKRANGEIIENGADEKSEKTTIVKCDEDDETTKDNDYDEEKKKMVPPRAVLYLVWCPTNDRNGETTASSFLEGTIRQSVSQLLLRRGDDPQMAYRVPHSTSSPSSSLSQSPKYSIHAETSLPKHSLSTPKRASSTSLTQSILMPTPPSRGKRKMHLPNVGCGGIYLVVDRVRPIINKDKKENGKEEEEDRFDNDYDLSDDDNDNKNEEDGSINDILQAEHLARLVATDESLRTILDGVTIGVSSDARSAPGLSECLDAFLYGQAERRVHVRKGLRGGNRGPTGNGTDNGDSSAMSIWRRFRRRSENNGGDDATKIFNNNGRSNNNNYTINSNSGKKGGGMGTWKSNSQLQRNQQQQPFNRRNHGIRTITADDGYIDPYRSSAGLVTVHPSYLLGPYPEAEADAARDVIVHQVTVAEWGRMGNVKSFGERSNEEWRERWGVRPPLVKKIGMGGKKLGWGWGWEKNSGSVDDIDGLSDDDRDGSHFTMYNSTSTIHDVVDVAKKAKEDANVVANIFVAVFLIFIVLPPILSTELVRESFTRWFL